ncbi:MAG: methyltransferase [Clostridia bacterium]|nr:methyltransferase [Clostridia bacterium]
MERIDDLQCRGLKLIQDSEKFCFGCDAVELANFVEGTPNDRAVDMGSGNGIITILLAGKKGIPTTAVEIQPELCDLAQRNVELNGLGNVARAVCTSMQEYANFNKASATIVVCNPPYRKVGSGFMQETDFVAAARHEIFVTLKEVVESASKLLSTGGKFYMVLPTERLAEAMSYCVKNALEPKILQILTPNEKKQPHLFLLKCIKDGKTGLNVLKERPVKAFGMEE